MASSSSEPGLKAEVVGISGGGCGGGGGGGGEASEAIMPSDQILIYRGLKKAKKERGCTAKERISKMPPCAAGKRSSIYRGVTRHRWTGRYEAHLWDKSTWNQNQNKKGKQVYLGAYDDEEAAARAYDLAALKYWGPGTLINFPVTDYSRDLEEMQNVSREDYLASLRRKSSGFSRGIAKYRGLSRPTQSSRWETSFGQVGGPNYFSGTGRFGECSTTESEYPGGFCIERKIDLTSYIKWWGTNKIRRTSSLPKPSDETKHGPEDIGGEMKILELRFQPTEPYQMPHLGLSHGGKKHQGSAVSALSILSRSAAYKSLQDKASKEQNEEENNHETKINEMEPNKVIQESTSGDGGSERLGVTLGMNWLPFQRPVSPLSTFLSTPLLTNYNTMDPLADPILWTNLVSVPMTSGLSLPTEVTKTEATSTYTCFHPEE